MQRIFGTACALLALTIPTLMISRQAVANEFKENGCRSVVGTYLATVKSPSTDATNYSELLTFNFDGNLTGSDSNSGGDPDGTTIFQQPVGPLHGSWKCVGREIVAKTFNFNFHAPHGITAQHRYYNI
ncbi:hypothetical protein [Tolypothrix sp. VBCCA 56010]|uniref:hypothetical protein n=1 Tax=Tolypothrix sp. VBCCA 56010 TaxID=3137731 RepID=UPI003D7E385A